MLADLLGWIKQIIYLPDFSDSGAAILPNGNYRKYVKFFAGMIFVVTLLGPVVSLFIDNDWEGVIAEAVSEAGAWEASEPPDFEEISETQSEIYEKYASEMAEDMAE